MTLLIYNPFHHISAWVFYRRPTYLGHGYKAAGWILGSIYCSVRSMTREVPSECIIVAPADWVRPWRWRATAGGRGRSRPVFRCRATGLRCCIFVRMTVLDKCSTEKGCEMTYRNGCWLCCLLTVLLITFHIICDYLYKKNDCVKYRCKFRYWICSSLGYFQGCQIAQDILVTPRRATDL